MTTQLEEDPDELPESGGLEDELGWSLHRVATAFRQSASGTVADLPGGPRGYQVLVAAQAGPPSSQLALAQRLGIDRTAMTYLIDELEAADLVTRRPHPADRRVRLVAITLRGQTALTGARRELRFAENILLGALQPDEAAQLRTLLVRVARSTDLAESCAATPDAGSTASPGGAIGGSATPPPSRRTARKLR